MCFSFSYFVFCSPIIVPLFCCTGVNDYFDADNSVDNIIPKSGGNVNNKTEKTDKNDIKYPKSPKRKKKTRYTAALPRF